jgi:hypothetical protein
MKENLILKQFETERVNGTYELEEFKWFFGSKMLEIEDEIIIDDKTIQYSEEEKTGFQYYDSESRGVNEMFSTPNLNSLKEENNSISLLPQNETTLKNNTKWKIKINMKNIIINYIFYKLKESRTFKGLSKDNFLNKNINLSIKNYIKLNVVDRYKYKNIDLYIKYNNIEQSQNVLSETKLQFKTNFNPLIKEKTNLIKDYTTNNESLRITTLDVLYNQIRPSDKYNFDYYFDLYFEKI